MALAASISSSPTRNVAVVSSSLLPHVSVMQPAAEVLLGSPAPSVGSQAKCLILKADGIMETHRRKVF
jgi:hypothetical protein